MRWKTTNFYNILKNVPKNASYSPPETSLKPETATIHQKQKQKLSQKEKNSSKTSQEEDLDSLNECFFRRTYQPNVQKPNITFT